MSSFRGNIACPSHTYCTDLNFLCTVLLLITSKKFMSTYLTSQATTAARAVLYILLISYQRMRCEPSLNWSSVKQTRLPNVCARLQLVHVWIRTHWSLQRVGACDILHQCFTAAIISIPYALIVHVHTQMHTHTHSQNCAHTQNCKHLFRCLNQSNKIYFCFYMLQQNE